ncbi:MAG TPA: prolyl oligopeptidase family serine peptidase [Gemmatimonadales bacterium]|nr:prolyl oligopeptidase family serine peptidase [Gemmatimonadales bacterium]
MQRFTHFVLLLAGLALLPAPVGAQQVPGSFTVEQVKSYPFPAELTASGTGSRIAWTFNEQGQRNIWVAEGPAFTPRRLTGYSDDDGQELTSLSISADGKWVVYVRGGDHGSNWDDGLPVNPTFNPVPPKVQIWSVPFAGGDPRPLGEGDGPVISPRSDVVAFIRGGQIWTVPVDGSSGAKALFTARGSNGEPVWSPDGSRLAFVSNRGDHAFIGVYRGERTPLTWIAPSFSRDRSPRWSPDGARLVFVRMPGAGGVPDSLLVRRHNPWSIWAADVASGQARPLWKAPATLPGSVPTTDGGFNLHWAQGRIVFLSYMDGWPHLYSLPESGGEPLLLTPGNFMAEHITLSADRKWLVFSGNTGPDPLDLDRRHVVRVPVDRAAVEVLTPGTGLEWTPVVTGDGAHLAYFSATPERPPLPAVMPFRGGAGKVLAADRIPRDFPAGLVTPKQVTFRAPDGLTVHGQVFEPPGSPTGKKPAIIYVHGGPPRQMLLGWHYSDYYSNAYASNQYLASRGFVVLSVNYRLGIGYGYDFHQPAGGGIAGAAEYQDVKAAAEWLATRPDVDAARIGIYGGSYGGYLVALALGRDSKLFAAGVDIHGVHDRTGNRGWNLLSPERYERAPDAESAVKVAWESSPVSAVDTWTSPVLIIHADDDRNVRFNQSTDLVRRLEQKGVPVETLVIVDDTHHFMRHANWLTVNQATAEFFVRKLGNHH